MTSVADPHVERAPANPPPAELALAGAVPLPAALQTKLDALRRVVRSYGPSLVAFSGGVDSALVLAVAAEQLGAAAVAMTAVSETMAEREISAAADFARHLGVAYEVVNTHELERPGFAENPVDRCYHCKAELLEHCTPVAARLGLTAVLLGVNLDDLGDHRPGLVAARERGAKQPLVEAGLTKAEVRQVAQHLGLPVWNKPQLACLSSRFPYGTSISPARLRMVDRFEQGLQDLGFTQLRVRFHELPTLPSGKSAAASAAPTPALARLELDASELERGLRLQREIVALGKRAGFVYVTLDLEGFRSGSANVVLRRLPIVGAGAPAAAPASEPAKIVSTTAPAAAPQQIVGAIAPPVAPAAEQQKVAARARKLVVAGLLRDPASGAVLLSQRRADQAMPLQWELPGGKVEPGEAPTDALRRELREELDIDARIGDPYDIVFHAYPEFDLVMLVYACHSDQTPVAREVAQVRWVLPPQLLDLPVLPADVPLMQRLMREAA